MLDEKGSAVIRAFESSVSLTFFAAKYGSIIRLHSITIPRKNVLGLVRSE